MSSFIVLPVKKDKNLRCSKLLSLSINLLWMEWFTKSFSLHNFSIYALKEPFNSLDRSFDPASNYFWTISSILSTILTTYTLFY